MSNLEVLEVTPVRLTRLGVGYVLMSDVPQPWRDLGSEQMSKRRARLVITGIGDAAFIEEWREWLDSLSQDAERLSADQ